MKGQHHPPVSENKKDKTPTIATKTYDYIIKRIRMMFLEHRFYWDAHADNLKEAQKFIITGNYIAMGWQSESLKVPVLMPKGGDMSKEEDFKMMDKLIDEQIRIIRRKFRKDQKSVLFYVHDNLITRALGFKETKFHMQCVGIMDQLRPMEQMAYKAKLQMRDSMDNSSKIRKK
jgi:hypothetical protein